MNGGEVSHALDEAERIETWLAAVRARATALAARGEAVPGYKLVARRVTRQWRDEAAALRLLRRLIRSSGLKQADLYDRRLKSPARMEKLLASLGRGAVEAAGAQMLVTENGVVLAPESDARAAVHPRGDIDPALRQPWPNSGDSQLPCAPRAAFDGGGEQASIE